MGNGFLSAGPLAVHQSPRAYLAAAIELVNEPLQAPTVRAAAATAGKAFIAVSCGSAQGLLLPPLFDAMEVKRNWQTKVGALQLLEGWSKSAPVEVALSLPEIIPVASGCLADAKPQVILLHCCKH